MANKTKMTEVEQSLSVIVINNSMIHLPTEIKTLRLDFLKNPIINYLQDVHLK